MKKGYLILMCLALLSLACTMSAAVSQGPAPITATAAAGPALITATTSPQLCAVVIADEALHVRSAPGADADVMTWLDRGDVVHVVNQINGDWWRVRFEGFEGYARALYLTKTECER